jgi:DNA-binding beta-propeller fold protein YncE
MLGKTYCSFVLSLVVLVAACGRSATMPSDTLDDAKSHTALAGISNLYLITTLEDSSMGSYDPSGLYLKAVDEETAQDIPGYAPYHLGQYGSAIPSPDGTVLALTYSSGDGRDLQNLTLFDLVKWEPLGGTILSVSGQNAVWAPDGKELFVTAHSESGRGLDVVVIEPLQRTVLRRFPLPHDGVLGVSPDGKRLFLFGNDFHYDAILPTKLTALDPENGTIVNEVELSTVPHGEALVDDAQHARCYATYSAWGILSNDGAKYYVFHPNEDVVSVIDTDKMTVARTKSVEPKQSVFRSVLATLFTRAAADDGIVYAPKLVLSPSGRYFYRLKPTNQVANCPIGGGAARPAGATVQMVDSESLSLDREIDVSDGDLAESTMKFDRSGRRLYAFDRTNVLVMDADSLQIIARRPAYPGDLVVIR